MIKKRAPSVRPPSVLRPPPIDGRPKNRLLAALPDEDFRRLLPDLKTIPIRTRQVLHQQGELIRQVYFPNGGVCSITTVLSDGMTVEAATVGDEGMLGIEAFLTDDAVAPGETVVQVPDTDAVMVSVETFRREIADHGPLHDLLGRYTQSVIAQMMQTTACNALHQVPQRCARWLLMTHDRMHRQDFSLSHEFLADAGSTASDRQRRGRRAARGGTDRLHAWARQGAGSPRAGSCLRVLSDHPRPLRPIVTGGGDGWVVGS
jgi:CRP-like cAMP-binding protein